VFDRSGWHKECFDILNVFQAEPSAGIASSSPVLKANCACRRPMCMAIGSMMRLCGDHPVAARLLGSVQCGVGALQQMAE